MRLLACPDKFRGTLTAPDAAIAMAEGASRAGVSSDVQPLADGGEGTLDAFGGANRSSTVTGPLRTAVEAKWRLAGGRAVIEMAEASGLATAGGPIANDPMTATTAGTGQLIARALEAGADEIIVGVGGSATTDGGLGAIRAMPAPSRLKGTSLLVACDVRSLFAEAAETFGPQKGATAAQVGLLAARLKRLEAVYFDEYGVEVGSLVGGGAAGGLAGGLAAVGARLVGGFEAIADAVLLYDQIEAADLVVTGEGQLDATSFDGKVVGGVLELCAAAETPVLVVAGQVDESADAFVDSSEANVEVSSLTALYGGERAAKMAAACVADAVSAWLSPK